MSVKRYDVMSYSLDVDGNSGPFVKYEDYAALESRYAALVSSDAKVFAYFFWPKGDRSQGFIVNTDEDPAHAAGKVDAQGLQWVSEPLYTAPPVSLHISDEIIRRIVFNLIYLAADEKLRSDDDSFFALVRQGVNEVRRLLS